MLYKKQLTREQALQKLRHYCGYQERNHQEVKEKLFSLGVRKGEHDVIIATLIEENYLNEERFAIAFARGKFKMNHWGRVKIKYELKQRKISDYCIRKALKQFEEEGYRAALEKLAADKYASLRKEPGRVRKKKVIHYLLQKGFETDLINRALQDIAE